MCPSRFGSPFTPASKGLTLIELVVVLAILAALAGVAVRSLEPIADQARHESTQKDLNNIEQAYLNGSTTGGSNLSYSGFLADVGRLPQSVGVDAERWLSELWENPGLPNYSIANFNDPNTTEDESSRTNNPILVASGWRGPYLLLPPGSNTLRDGYGRPMVCLNSSGGVIAAAGAEIASVVSSGSNGLLDASDVGYQRDLPLPGGAWNASRIEGAIPVRVTLADGISPPTINSGERILARVYGPQNGTAAVLAEIELSSGTVPEFGGTLAGIVAGPRVVRVIKVSGSTPNESIVSESLVRQLMVVPGMNSEIVLRLP
ncbi:MAG: prepilin-type N-terminal cleavage/methylation domain-containing protein [Planctomycetota bacterium]